jgi:hypothetical protein
MGNRVDFRTEMGVEVRSSVLMRDRDPFQCTAVLTLVIMALPVCETHVLLYFGEISVSYGGEYEDDCLLGCYAM